ncbi:MAG: deoxyribodipyrimidine photo-lyase [Bacteroidota bacterium]
MPQITIFWFRRDLRLEDNAGLFAALKDSAPVLPLFIFDREILDELNDPQDARVEFIHHAISGMHGQLQEMGAPMEVRYGKPSEIWPELLAEYDVKAVYTNRDYEPYARNRDSALQALLEERCIAWRDFKDHVIFDGNEVVKDDGTPYVVFTPYSRMWKRVLHEKMISTPQGEISYHFRSFPTEEHFDSFYRGEILPMIGLDEMGFSPSEITFPDKEVPRDLIREYDETRNFPAQRGTSRLGIHFRFGTISIREKARRAQRLNDTFLTELIWRDFYSMILQHFPHVAEGPFREKYSFIPWRNNEEEFAAWKEGRTGYPIVDAGMRELNATGFMHNRVRMIVASFLTKHLLIDWRWGEAYFAEKLLDFELASNNGGWQWAAGSGTDAAPYFRVFNPYSQQKKFDKNFQYIKKWVPEYQSVSYPEPIVDHKMARQRCLDTYKAGLAQADAALVK